MERRLQQYPKRMSPSRSTVNRLPKGGHATCCLLVVHRGLDRLIRSPEAIAERCEHRRALRRPSKDRLRLPQESALEAFADTSWVAQTDKLAGPKSYPKRPPTAQTSVLWAVGEGLVCAVNATQEAGQVSLVTWPT